MISLASLFNVEFCCFSFSFLTCQPYNGTVCRNYILGDEIFYDLSVTNFEMSELVMTKFKQAFTAFSPSQNCFDFAFRLVCHYAFPPCRVGVPIPTKRPICKGDCLTSSTELCPTVWQAILSSIQLLDLGHVGIPNCANLPYMNGGDESECIGVSDVLPPGNRENTEVTGKKSFL